MNRLQEIYNELKNEGMSDKKATFIAARMLARENGTLKVSKVESRLDSDLPERLVDLVKSLGTGIWTIKEFPQFRSLAVMEKYIFDGGNIIRRKVDHLDQVTIWIKK